MYAVEFETQNKGKYIELPFILPEKEPINIRVILISEQPIENKITTKRGNLSQLTKFSKGKKIMEFCREDAYYNEI